MVIIHVAIRQTQLVTLGVWLNVFVMGTIEQPPVQKSIPITTPQPIIEVTITCAYYQHVGHEFKNCSFMDDKLKRLLKKKLITSLPPIAMNTLNNTCWCIRVTNPITIGFGYSPNTN
jgi:hypothetical protein